MTNAIDINYNDTFCNMVFQAVIMAGGKGSRMSDLVANQAKCLAPVGNMPMLWYSLNYLQNAGFKEAIVVTCETADQILAALGDSLTIAVDVVTLPMALRDGGTADALRHIRDKIEGDVVVMSCDMIIDFPLTKLLDEYRVHKASMVALLAPVPDCMNEMTIPGPRTKKKFEKDIIGLEISTGRLFSLASEADYDDVIHIRKSILKKHPRIRYTDDLSDAHLYIFRKWVLDYLRHDKNISSIKGELVPLLLKKQFESSKDNEVSASDSSAQSVKVKKDFHSFAQEPNKFLQMAFEMTQSNQAYSYEDPIRCYGYIMKEGFCMRANTVPTFLALNKQIVTQWTNLAPCQNRPLISQNVVSKAKNQKGEYVYPGCSNSSIGDSTHLGEKITISCSVIGKHCRIGDGVKIMNSVIFSHIKIEDGRPCNINMSIAAEETVGTINQTDIEVQAQDFEKELDVSHTTMCKYIPPPTQDHDYSVPSQDNMEMLIAASLEIERLNAMIENVNKSKSFIFRLSKDSTQVSFYTGFKDYETLMLFYQIIEPTAASMTRYSQYKRIQGGKSKSTRVCFPTQALSLLDQFLLVIKKLRVGNFNQELADEFGVSPATVSRLTISWCNYLYFFLGSQPLWPSKAQVNDHMPDVFREYYSNTRVILDCTEIFVQRPSSLYLNSEFYSHYKGTTTLKGLVGIMPSGAISFVSSLHLGSISDKAITRLSGILDLLEPGDQVMVDKGFVIKDLLEEVGASLVIPPFLTANRSQFEADEVSMTQSIARLRVHVERAIRRVKCYHIFDRPIPLTLAGSINQIWSVCCLLTNFYGNLF
ncbi:Translation initiation factor eIF-2B subunit gamma [Nymphon striatum]|nr:Translation initiation factor eIF-2B subunit gamma [Nymphon striatum]